MPYNHHEDIFCFGIEASGLRARTRAREREGEKEKKEKEEKNKGQEEERFFYLERFFYCSEG